MITSERKAKIRWNCRRGMLELDLLLGHFMTRGFDNLTSEQVTHFEALLDYSDPEIYAWLMGFEAPDNPEILDLVATIRA